MNLIPSNKHKVLFYLILFELCQSYTVITLIFLYSSGAAPVLMGILAEIAIEQIPKYDLVVIYRYQNTTKREPHAQFLGCTVRLRSSKLYGLYSLSGWTSYRKISWSFEATMRFGFKIFQWLWSWRDACQISEWYDHHNIQSRRLKLDEIWGKLSG